MPFARSSILFLAAVVFAACTDAPDADGDPTDTVEAPREFRAATALGSYRVRVVPKPAPIPLNELFELTIEVTPVADAPSFEAVSVDADMPEHKHGMNTQPVVVEEAGSWRVEGMLFHMPGAWEIYVDVDSGGVIERAVIPVDIETP